MPTKSTPTSNICLKDNGKNIFDPKCNAELFKDFFSGIASNLVSKLPKPSNKFRKNFLLNYYNSINITQNLKFQKVSEETILNILQKLNPSKAPGIYNITGKFLKDEANALAAPIAQHCNLSIKTSQNQMYSVCK